MTLVSSVADDDFPKPITILCYAWRPISLVYFVKTIDDLKLPGFRFTLKDFEIKKRLKKFCFFTEKTNVSMLMCVCSVIDHKAH